MRFSISVGVTAALLALAGPVSAAEYVFDFTGTNLFGSPATTTGSGVFTTADTSTVIGGRTAFAITGITGLINGSAIAAPGGAFYGNYFTTGPAFLDGSGVNFRTAGNTLVSFFFQDTVSRYRVNTQSPGATGFVTATSSLVPGVPEPSSWAMLIIGFGLAGAALRRRHRQMGVVAA